MRLTKQESLAGARRSITSAGNQIAKLGDTIPGSLEQANAITQALCELREALYWVASALESAQEKIS